MKCRLLRVRKNSDFGVAGIFLPLPVYTVRSRSEWENEAKAGNKKEEKRKSGNREAKKKQGKRKQAGIQDRCAHFPADSMLFDTADLGTILRKGSP